jgi:signal transduction histidine kinase/CheY-like chemotaxis protein
MDAGRFESSSQPFNFHRAINALVASLKVAATAKRLNLDVSLDERIDNLPQSIEMHGQRASYVIGDEIRLRQVLTNIASNAVKFSREGRGGIKVRTRLIWPEDEEKEQSSEMIAVEEEKPAGDRQNDQPSDGSGTSSEWRDSDVTHNHPPSANHTPFANDSEMTFPGARTPREKERDIEKEAGLHEVDARDGNAAYPPSRPRDYLDRIDSDDSDDYRYKRPKDFVIVRIEIEDNGPGIRPSDMVDQRLFSAYVQTEIGRVQGGKGSGLGLAIVRAIVQMTRGRLVVKSSKNGTTFWIEQRYYFATPQEVQALHALQELPTPLSFSGEDLPNRPVRPPVKPYRDGESSYSQYSQSKHDAALAVGLQSTPTSEVDRSLLGAAAVGSPVNISSDSIKAGNASISSMPGATGGGASSITSGGGVGNTSATNAIDVHSPLTSEQWTQNNPDRPVLGMPTMSITAPTPQSGSPFPSAPSPTRSVLSASSPSAPAVGASAFTGPSGADLKGTTPAFNRIASDGASSNRSATSSPSSVPQGSPAGEEAFTPGTREAVTLASPEVNAFASGPPGSISPLPMPPSMTRPESIISASGASATGSQASSGAQQPLQPQQPQQVERLSALIVDDDPLTRKLMSRMMARLGCVVEEAENGQMFLDVALGNEAEGRPPKHFDIVTLDNAMPVMTGEEAIKHFRRAGRKDLVVGATGNALKGDQTSYLRVSRVSS